MQIPLQITYRDFPPSDAIAAKIQQQVAKLEHFSNRITNCRVVVEAPHQHHRQGNLYHVRISLSLPGKELAIANSSKNHAHEDIYVAIRDAFAAAERQLKRYAAVQKS